MSVAAVFRLLTPMKMATQTALKNVRRTLARPAQGSVAVALPTLTLMRTTSQIV
jgi:hypothetical protein